MKKKRIYIVAPLASEFNGAAHARVLHFISMLSNKFEVECLTQRARKINKEQFSHETTMVKLASNKSNLGIRLFYEILLGLNIIFKLIFVRSTVYLFSSPPYFTMLMVLPFLIFAKRKPIVLDLRDVYPDVLVHLNLINKHSRINKALMAINSFLYKKCALIDTVTNECVTMIKNNYPEVSDRIILCRNGFNEDEIAPSDEKFEVFTAVFHGIIGRFQNSNLLEALIQKSEKEGSGIRYMIIGDGPGLKEINLNRDSVVHKKTMPHKEVMSIVNKCHIGLSFRTDDQISYSAFPVKVYEYIGAGIPVAMTPRSPSSVEVEENQLGKAFENSQVNDIFNYILEIKEKYYKKSSFINNSRNSYARTKAAQSLIEKIENL